MVQEEEEDFEATQVQPTTTGSDDEQADGGVGPADASQEGEEEDLSQMFGDDSEDEDEIRSTNAGCCTQAQYMNRICYAHFNHLQMHLRKHLAKTKLL